MTGDYGFYNENTKYAFATKKAMAIDYSQGDSLFLHADTLMLKTLHLNTDSMYREMPCFPRSSFLPERPAGSNRFAGLLQCRQLPHPV